MASSPAPDKASTDELFGDGQLPPPKVAWLHPFELLRTGYHALVSQVATGFLDRREMLAAINRGDRPGGGATRHDALVRDEDERVPPRSTLRPSAALTDQGAVWIDYAADLGDSWDATYATALLMARRHLTVRGHAEPLPQANVLVLGGDLVYPTPGRRRYKTRLRSAFVAAMREGRTRPKPCVLAIPGNHDWYDGLTNFVREFCQGGRLGGWTLVQSRSYFAAKVAPGWWIWGIDIALDTRIDAPQQAYFLEILQGATRAANGETPWATHEATFKKDDRIILCTAKPVWLDDPKHSDEAYRNLAYFVRDVIEGNHATAPIILAGDLHHYSRYEQEKTKTQLITAGGGGAYLSGTHHLPAKVPELTRGGVADAEQATGEDCYRRSPFTYPSRAESRHLALKAIWLAFRRANWPFALTVGAFYWLMAWPLRNVAGLLTVDRSQHGVRAFVVACAIVLGSVVYALAVNKGSRVGRSVWGLLHGVLHVLAGLALVSLCSDDGAAARAVDRVLQSMLVPSAWAMYGWLSTFVLGVLFVLAASFVGATIVGAYLVVSDLLFGWHRNDVFSAQSIVDYRNFLRIRIDNTTGAVDIYPIGLQRVPRQWRGRVSVRSQAEAPEDGQAMPCFEPGDVEMRPHLIEAPIHIRSMSSIA